MVIPALGPEADRFPNLGLHGEFQVSQNYTVRPYLRKKSRGGARDSLFSKRRESLISDYNLEVGLQIQTQNQG